MTLHIVLDERNFVNRSTEPKPFSNGKPSLPPFITDEFAIRILQAEGGRATLRTMQQYLFDNYDCDMKKARYATQKSSDLKSASFHKNLANVAIDEMIINKKMSDDLAAGSFCIPELIWTLAF